MSHRSKTAWTVWQPLGLGISLTSISKTRRDAISTLTGRAEFPAGRKWSWWYRQGFRAIRVNITPARKE